MGLYVLLDSKLIHSILFMVALVIWLIYCLIQRETYNVERIHVMYIGSVAALIFYGLVSLVQTFYAPHFIFDLAVLTGMSAVLSVAVFVGIRKYPDLFYFPRHGAIDQLFSFGFSFSSNMSVAQDRRLFKS
jgi:hypothetical protein